MQQQYPKQLNRLCPMTPEDWTILMHRSRATRIAVCLEITQNENHDEYYKVLDRMCHE